MRDLTLGETWIRVMKDVSSQASKITGPGKQGGLNAEI